MCFVVVFIGLTKIKQIFLKIVHIFKLYSIYQENVKVNKLF